MELYIVRHGQSTANIGEAIFDAPLTDLGFKQADTLGREMADISFDRIYASSLLRAAQTAVGIAQRQPNRNIPVQILPELVEADTPQSFSGNADLLRKINPPVQMDRLELLPFASDNDRAQYVLENYVFRNAYSEGFDTERTDNSGNVIRSREQKVLFVTHGVFIAYLLSNLVHFPFDPDVVIELNNTGVSRLSLYTFNDIRRVTFHCYNNTRHLPKEYLSG